MTAGDYMHQANAAHGGTRSGATSPTFSEITQGTMTSQGTLDLKNFKYCWTPVASASTKSRVTKKTPPSST